MPLNLKPKLAGFAVLFSVLAPSVAGATAYTCATIDGTNHTSPSNIPVNLKIGETITISTPASKTLQVSIEKNGSGGKDDGICNPLFDGTSCNGFSFSAGFDSDYLVQAFSRGGEAFTLSCAAGSGGGGSADANTSSRAALIAAGRSTNAIGSAVSSAVSSSLQGGSQISAAGSRFFFSTKRNGENVDVNINAWASAGYSHFNGDFDGNGGDLTFGADVLISKNALIGALVSLDKIDLNNAGTSIDEKAVSIGAYFAARLPSQLFFDGFIVGARPQYTIAGTRFRASRVAGGVNLRTVHALGNTTLSSFVGFRGFSERHPTAIISGTTVSAHSVSMLTGSIGTTAVFNPNGNVRPNVSVAADFNHYNDGVGTKDSYVSPRLGAGLVADGSAGTFSMDINFSEVLKNTDAISLGVSFAKRF